MSTIDGKRHPFLDDLTEESVLSSTLLRRDVTGRENIRKIVAAVGKLYTSQTPVFLGTTDDRVLYQYEAELVTGQNISAITIIKRNADGSVPHVTVAFHPLDSVLALAGRLGGSVDADFGPGYFL
ncbi:hypothetical protein AWB71_05453 [Caballeronia peredens]|nr:hypothetical protein AWB71_05453 [Caballeronia peredens]